MLWSTIRVSLIGKNTTYGYYIYSLSPKGGLCIINLQKWISAINEALTVIAHVKKVEQISIRRLQC
jgi:ribosomal protein S2